MKSGSILILGLYWCFNYSSKVDSKECTKARYEPGDEKSITRKFQSEWGIFGYINRALYRSHDDFDDLAYEDKKGLCACAILKRNGNVGNYNTIKNNMACSGTTINIKINYLCFKPYPHPAPGIKCTSGTEKVAIMKSFTKKAFLDPQWDIYIAKIENDYVGDFVGIIKNVDLVSTKPKRTSNEDYD